MLKDLMRRPRRLGIVAATLATGAGLAFMAAAGAPRAYIAVNGAALAIGLALLAVAVRSRGEAVQGGGAFVLAAALGLLATAIFGVTIDGATRWVRIGVVTLQPGLLLLPVMILAYARCRDRLAIAGVSAGKTAAAAPADALQSRRNNPIVSPTPITTMPIFKSFSGSTLSARAPR